jgi:hypothetical protein
VANKYYAANNGSEAFSGLSELLPKLLFASAVALATGSGDQALARGGDFFNEGPSIPASNITYDVYGQGRPTLSCADPIPSWTFDSVQAGGDRWYATFAGPAPNYCYRDSGGAAPGNMSISLNQASLAACDQLREHFWDTTTTRVYLVVPTGHVPGVDSQVYGSRRNSLFVANAVRTNITLRGFRLFGTNDLNASTFAIQAVSVPGANGWVLDNLIGEWCSSGAKIDGGTIANNTTITMTNCIWRYMRSHGCQIVFHNNAVLSGNTATGNGRCGFSLLLKNSTFKTWIASYNANKLNLWPNPTTVFGQDAGVYSVGSEATFEQAGSNLITGGWADHNAKANIATDALGDNQTFLRNLSTFSDLYGIFFEGGTVSGTSGNIAAHNTLWGNLFTGFESNNGHGNFTLLNNLFFGNGTSSPPNGFEITHQIKYSGNWPSFGTSGVDMYCTRDHVRFDILALALGVSPFTQLTAVASIAAVQATPGSWFLDKTVSTNWKLYVRNPTSTVIAASGVQVTPTVPDIIDYNVYSTSGLVWKYASGAGASQSASGASAIATLFTNLGFEQHGIQADPLYVNTGTGDFTLQVPASPALNSGVVIAGLNDLGSIKPYNGPAPDRGYWESGTSAKLSLSARNVQLDALAARYNNGYWRIYSGAQPATPNTAIGAQVLLAELRFGSPAFAAASGGGPISAIAITDDADADNTGAAAWFRIFEADGVTPILDGTVGTSGCNLNMSTTSIVQHSPIRISSYTHALPMTPA